MCRNISNLLFVLFAVVLGLAASEGEGFLPAGNKCYLFLMNSGKEYCQLLGYDTFDSLIPETCDLVCGGPTVQLPKEACPNRSMHNPCTQGELNDLQKWADGLEDKRQKIKAKLCSG
uniref:Putative ixodes 10 kDa peptide protein n=1 Tax=Ixodes ricinus TaxID=34613 RepID=A0A0K8RBX1_IXORI